MKDSDILELHEPKLSLPDMFYLPQVLIGLGTTMKHMLAVLGGKDLVIQYPEEKREDLPIEKGGMLTQTYRGVHRLNKDEEGRVRCVACPVDAIELTHTYDIVGLTRQEMIFDKAKLLRMYDQTVKEEPM
jgi:NADH-quinone oxidoreductase subunit I